VSWQNNIPHIKSFDPEKNSDEPMLLNIKGIKSKTPNINSLEILLEQRKCSMKSKN